LQRKSGGRDEAVLDTPRRADEEALAVIAMLELVGDGESRDDVTAGATSCQDCSHGMTINHLFSVI
jgi:hypothetical protein